MKKINSLLVLILLITLTGCASNTGDTNNKKVVVTSTVYPFSYMVENIMKDNNTNVEINTVYPEGSDMHTYEPTAQDIKKIQDSNVVFYIDNEEESFMDEVIKTDPTKDETNYIELSNIATVKDEYTGDPHIWISPKLQLSVLEEIKKTLENEKIEIDNEKYESIVKKIKNIDKSYTEAAAKQTKPIVVDHDAFGYLAKDYGLKFLSLTGTHEEEEASASVIKETIDTINKDNIKTIFTQDEEFSNPTLKQISKETGAEVKTLYHMSNPIGEKDFMNQNSANAKALTDYIQ